MLQFNCYKTSTVLVMKWFLVNLKHLTDIHWYECIPFIVSECDWNICDSLLLFSPSIITHLYTLITATHTPIECMCCAVLCRAYISIYLYILSTVIWFSVLECEKAMVLRFLCFPMIRNEQESLFNNWQWTAKQLRDSSERDNIHQKITFTKHMAYCDWIWCNYNWFSVALDFEMPSNWFVRT